MEEAFQSPEKLHLTLGVLRIFSTEEEVCFKQCHILSLISNLTLAGFYLENLRGGEKN